MLITRIVFVFSLLALGACASSPRYVAADSATDYGYYSRKISENRYRINFNGGRRADLQEARDFALLRAAELTVSRGYDWFEIVDRETSTIERREPRVGFGVERSYTTYRSCGLLGCSETVRPATWTRMSLDSARPETAHSHSIEVLMGKGKMPQDGNYYDASAVLDALYQEI